MEPPRASPAAPHRSLVADNVDLTRERGVSGGCPVQRSKAVLCQPARCADELASLALHIIQNEMLSDGAIGIVPQ